MSNGSIKEFLHQNELSQHILSTIPQNMLKKLYFCDEWPLTISQHDFATLSIKSKMELKPAQQGIPTERNYWIWFGPSPIDRRNNNPIPRFNDVSVINTLYSLLITQPERRLVNLLSDIPLDVNPYKAHYGRGPKTRFQNFFKKSSKGNDEDTIKECAQVIDTKGYKDFPVNDIKIFMVHEGYPPPVIESALKLLGLMT